jgi:hypothetical protein
VQHGPPFIGEWRGGSSHRRVRSDPRVGPTSHWYVMSDLLHCVRGGVPRDIPYDLSIRGIPSVGPAEPLARG